LQQIVLWRAHQEGFLCASNCACRCGGSCGSR
jgi:hypothetical protein